MKRIKIKINKFKKKLAKKVQNVQCQQPSLQELENKYSKTHTGKNWLDLFLGNKNQTKTTFQIASMIF